MIRVILVTILYLMAALAVEMAVQPQFLMLAPPWMGGLLDLPLLAMAGILIGLMRGEVEGMAVALLAAALLGISQPPGLLGAAIASFSSAAFLAGQLARHFRFRGFAFRTIAIAMLLVIERLVWWGARRFLWPDTPLEIHWAAILLTALAGALLYKLFAPGLKRNLLQAE